MKHFRKIYSLIMAILLSASLTACSVDGVAEFVEYQLDPSGYVVFQKEENAEGVRIPVDQIDSYESLYADYMGDWYAQQLNTQELRIYNGYLYAMEHCYKGFSLYVAEKKPDVAHIRNMVALDSPFLEQNVRSDGEFRRTWDPDRHGTKIYFHTDWFAQEHWDLKMQALEKCRQIVQEIPDEYDTQEEKMLYLYHYVCDQITYTKYVQASAQDYLYDAVYKGATNCDGYSNMLLLLYRLIGVEACEIMSGDTNTPEEEGHTWVAAKLGENYYHFDPTYEDTTAEFLDERTIYFGVSDQLITQENIDFDDMRPHCEDTSRDFAFTQLTLDNIKEEKEIKSLAKLTDKRTKSKEYVTYVLVNDTVDENDLDKMLDSYIKKVTAIKRVNVSSLPVGEKSILKITTTAK